MIFCTKVENVFVMSQKMQFFPTVFNVPVVRKAEELLTYLQFFPWPWVRTMYTSTSVSNQLNCRKFENGLYWLMMYWQFPNLEVKWMDFQTKLEKYRVTDSFDQFCWHFLLTWILKLLFFWRENSNSTFLRENSKLIFLAFPLATWILKLTKFCFWRKNSNEFFSLIILANLFSSLFSQHVKRREESKVQDAGNKFLSTATRMCCVGYLIMLELALAKNIHLRLKLKNGIMKMLFMSFQKGQQSTWTEMLTFLWHFLLTKVGE